MIGLYLVLWGKGKEAVKVAELPADETINVVIVPGEAGSKEEVTEVQEELESKGKESPLE